MNSVKRRGAFAVAVAAIAVGVAQPAVAEPSTTGCGESDCGNHATECWSPYVRARPAHTRRQGINCQNVTDARLVTPPPHGTLTNVEHSQWGVTFDLRPDEDAPRHQEAVFEVEGAHGDPIDVTLWIETFPRSENTAPVCAPDPVSQRTDGTAPAEVDVMVHCFDMEHDEYTLEGGGPGVHPYSPLLVGSNTGSPFWRYRTATSAGTETTTVWATDILGARTPDLPVDVTVGPDADRLPTCDWSQWGVVQLFTRPGAIRRFGFDCSDPDGDPFDVALSDPPDRGLVVPVFDENPYPGTQHVEGTYAPAGDGMASDEFAFTPSGPHGAGAPRRMMIVPRALPENGGGYCGYGGNYIYAGRPGSLVAHCIDDEGDPLTGELTVEPKHGTSGPPVTGPGRYGEDEIRIPYVPDPGFVGYDCVKLAVSDGHGFETEVVIDIWVTEAPPEPTGYWEGPPPPPLPPLPPLPPGPPMPMPGAGQDPPRTAPTRALAQQALGTTAVKRLSAGDGTEVWARARLSKSDLLRFGRSPGVVVLCRAACQIRSDSILAGLPSVRATRRKGVATKTPGQAHVVTLDLSRAEQRALRRARRPRATFNLNVRAAGGRARALRRSIPIGR